MTDPKWGAPGVLPLPHGPTFSWRFSEIYVKIICWHPPPPHRHEGWRPLLRKSWIRPWTQQVYCTIEDNNVSRKSQYKDVYRRTIEMPQRARTFQVNCCLKVHNAHLKLLSPISG